MARFAAGSREIGRLETVPVVRERIGRALQRESGPIKHLLTLVRRIWVGVYQDGFIHAGNFAYMALLSLFPFFIAAAAIITLIGEPDQREASIDAILVALPRTVGLAIGPVARDVVSAREGWLLWVGGAIGLWTASSLIETIRDILHRSYGTLATRAFWQYRIGSIGMIFASVLLLLLALGAQVAIAAAEEVVAAYFPAIDALAGNLSLSRWISAIVLFLTIWLLFETLAPQRFQGRKFPKWPGALFIAVWWVLLIVLLPYLLRNVFTYDLTYGSLAGVMIALFFFWLVGLGLVVGAALNAALVGIPELELDHGAAP